MNTENTSNSNGPNEILLRVQVEGGRTNSNSGQATKIWATLKSILEVTAKLLPGLTLILVLVGFRAEISAFLKGTSKVEAFGVKLERAEFEKRLQASGEKLPNTTKTPSWTEIPFKKLKQAGATLAALRLLWVDDHPENNFYLRRILSDLGVQIEIARNNSEGLDAAMRKDFDVIVSDFNRDKPLDENGGQLATKLRSLGYEASFIFYTSDPTRVPTQIPKTIATNDPAVVLAKIADAAIEKQR